MDPIFLVFHLVLLDNRVKFSSNTAEIQKNYGLDLLEKSECMQRSYLDQDIGCRIWIWGELLEKLTAFNESLSLLKAIEEYAVFKVHQFTVLSSVADIK